MNILGGSLLGSGSSMRSVTGLSGPRNRLFLISSETMLDAIPRSRALSNLWEYSPSTEGFVILQEHGQFRCSCTGTRIPTRFNY